MRSRFLVLASLLLLALTVGVSACSNSANTTQKSLTLAAPSALPDYVRDLPPRVQEAYRFAIANPDTLKYIPCYCGCGSMHGDNLECYVAAYNPDGTVAEFDNHAAY
jgi:hypothetical protein